MESKSEKKRKTIQQDVELSSRVPVLFKIQDSTYELSLAVDSRNNVKIIDALKSGKSIEVEKIIQYMGEERLKSRILKSLVTQGLKRSDDEFRLTY